MQDRSPNLQENQSVKALYHGGVCHDGHAQAVCEKG